MTLPIAETSELGLLLDVTVDTARATLLLDLAKGLITAEIGDQIPWPAVAKSVGLAAAARPYRNPDSLLRDTVGGTMQIYNAEEMGVYLTDSEVARLRRWLNGPGGSITGRPQGSFPAARAWPDPAGHR